MSENKVGPPIAQVLETEIDGDISLYDPSTEKVTVLNDTASDVWLLCDGEHTADEIKRLLASSYQVEPDEISDEVDKAIDLFRKAGLLT